MKIRLFCAVLLAWAVISSPRLAAQNGNPGIVPGKHRGAVTALVRDWEGRILSAGEDGFLEIWNTESAETRFQLSPYGIKFMAARPGKPEITVVESDDLGLYRVSAWNYETKKNLFTLRFRDSVSYINYSASGGFLIVARSGRTGVAFIHSETGEVLESPEGLSGSVAFAATGRAERNMIAYLSHGVLSYWDLETGNESQHFQVPPNIQSPLLFGNNRFLGGFDSGGLLILDAVTGSAVVRDAGISGGILFTGNPETSRFYCLAPAGERYTLYLMEVNLSGRLTTVSRRAVPSAAAITCCVSGGGGDTVILGTGEGNLSLLTRSGAKRIKTENPVQVIDAAASEAALAFITENKGLGYIPLDYSKLENGFTLHFGDAAAYTAIGADSSVSRDVSDGGISRFLLWENSRAIPLLKTFTGAPGGNGEGYGNSDLFLDKLPLRFPLQTADILGGSILFLDTSGSVFVTDRETGELRFSYTASGSVDAAFLDENTIIVGRSVAAADTPFLTVNITTGETVPLAYPAMVGVRVCRGASGTIYGAVIEQAAGNIQTSIIRLNLSNPARSERLVLYNGEDASFAMSESAFNLASTLGGGEAALYRNSGRGIPPEIVSLERSSGLPLKILDGKRWFIILDGEGGITWHDNRTGEILAVFRLYQDFWVLEKGNETISGKTGGS